MKFIFFTDKPGPLINKGRQKQARNKTGSVLNDFSPDQNVMFRVNATITIRFVYQLQFFSYLPV